MDQLVQIQLADRTTEKPLVELVGWSPDDPRRWSIDTTSARVRQGTHEWTELRGPNALLDTMVPGGHALIEVAVTGKADAAGLSFGPFKDFLVALPGDGPEHLLQLEIERGAGWRLRIDGRLHGPAWWTSEAAGADDLWRHELRLKARYAQEVTFKDFAISSLQAAPQVSVIMTCNRFSQRLRAALRAWSGQHAETGCFEVIVANPQSPDATHSILAAAAASFPHLRVAELELEAGLGRNKGIMINRALRWARGSWVLLTDADCLFPPTTMPALLAAAAGTQWGVLFGARYHLTPRQTQAVLAGAVDPADPAFYRTVLSSRDAAERYPNGYTQFVPRPVLEAVRYREDTNHFAHTDQIFVADCARRGAAAALLDGLACLHLTHPFAWYGTDQHL